MNFHINTWLVDMNFHFAFCSTTSISNRSSIPLRELQQPER